MRCSNCDSPEVRVTRTSRDTAESILRQRTCLACGTRVCTVEVELPPGSVVLRNSSKKLERLSGFLRVHFS
jgi:transcriptional regulator NrdR family protein